MSSPEQAPAEAQMSAPGELAAKAEALASEILRSVEREGSGALPPNVVQALVAAACRAYGADADSERHYPILSRRDAISATDVMVVCAALLKAVDLQVFELGMWSSWTGR